MTTIEGWFNDDLLAAWETASPELKRAAEEASKRVFTGDIVQAGVDFICNEALDDPPAQQITVNCLQGEQK